MVVLSLENFIVLVGAVLIGEGLNLRQIAGAGVVLCGIAMVGLD